MKCWLALLAALSLTAHGANFPSVSVTGAANLSTSTVTNQFNLPGYGSPPGTAKINAGVPWSSLPSTFSTFVNWWQNSQPMIYESVSYTTNQNNDFSSSAISAVMQDSGTGGPLGLLALAFNASGLGLQITTGMGNTAANIGGNTEAIDIFMTIYSTNDVAEVDGITIKSPYSIDSAQALAAVALDIWDQGNTRTANSYAVKINDQTSSTNAWAIKTGLGKVDFGDTVRTAALVVTNGTATILATGNTNIVDLSVTSPQSVTNYLSQNTSFAYATNGVNNQEITKTYWMRPSTNVNYTFAIPSGWKTNKLAGPPVNLTNSTWTRMIVTALGNTATAATQTNVLVSFQYY